MSSDVCLGGRGLKVEAWNNTRPRYLTDIRSYNKNTTGYWSQLIDSLPHTFPREIEYFTSRTRGFLVPPASGNYTIYLHCDDRCELYLSNSSRPEDQVWGQSVSLNAFRFLTFLTHLTRVYCTPPRFKLCNFCEKSAMKMFFFLFLGVGKEHTWRSQTG